MEKRINTSVINCMRKLSQVHYSSHTSNKRELMEKYIGKQEHMLTIVKKEKVVVVWSCDHMEEKKIGKTFWEQMLEFFHTFFY